MENRHSNLPQHLRSALQPSATALPRTMLSVLLFRRLCLLPAKLRANNRFMPAPKEVLLWPLTAATGGAATVPVTRRAAAHACKFSEASLAKGS